MTQVHRHKNFNLPREFKVYPRQNSGNVCPNNLEAHCHFPVPNDSISPFGKGDTPQLTRYMGMFYSWEHSLTTSPLADSTKTSAEDGFWGWRIEALNWRLCDISRVTLQIEKNMKAELWMIPSILGKDIMDCLLKFNIFNSVSLFRSIPFLVTKFTTLSCHLAWHKFSL